MVSFQFAMIKPIRNKLNLLCLIKQPYAVNQKEIGLSLDPILRILPTENLPDGLLVAKV